MISREKQYRSVCSLLNNIFQLKLMFWNNFHICQTVVGWWRVVQLEWISLCAVVLTRSDRWLSPIVKLCFPAEASRLCWTTECRFLSHTALRKRFSVCKPEADWLVRSGWICSQGCSQSYLVVVALAVLDFPLLPHFAQCRRRAAADQTVQKHHHTQNVHPG